MTENNPLMPLLASARKERDGYRDACINYQYALEAALALAVRLAEQRNEARDFAIGCLSGMCDGWSDEDGLAGYTFDNAMPKPKTSRPTEPVSSYDGEPPV